MAAIRAFTQDGNQVTKLKLTDEERARSCRARYQALKEELEKRPLDWSTFDKERTPYNGDSGTLRRLDQIGAGGIP